MSITGGPNETSDDPISLNFEIIQSKFFIIFLRGEPLIPTL
jgi:hypothetical protein